MEPNHNVVKDIQIAYIGGGSRGWAWGLMSDLAQEGQLSGTVKLYDLNYDAANTNAVIGNRLSERSDAAGKWKYEAVPSLKEALTGSDFVIISILPGSFQEMHSDVHLPEEYGIYQSVGDTVGPGGAIRALRTIPIYVELAKSIRTYAPDSWIINYTNPMTLCTRTLYEVFPEIKAIGCCHEVFGTQKLLASMLDEMANIPNVNRRDIKVNVLGINHFTWLDQASYQGMDLFPMYREFAHRHSKDGFEGSEEGHWMNNHFASAERVKFDLFRKFGLIAAAGDRHLAEFMPHSWYLKNPETVHEWKFSLTKVDWRKQNQRDLIAKSARLAQGEEEFAIRPTGEEGIDMVKALLGLGDIVTNVNMPNRGQMGNTPLGAVVETNAIFGRDSVKPIISGELPPEINSLVQRHIWNQETILQASLNKDKDKAFRAFVSDPLVNISPEQARELFERMLDNTKSFLPEWK
ncbi:alpha-glucosidase/alpha-galactosidase [Paenibacillus sp. GP183]|jgi:galacturan 1,4-alpha-galacturonidase|uniref:family 4 glycosyl hydrolase n=1 Tax=Paenibacillus sp. GP183 TaxID=1882751 RepID=UPI00089CFADA|nr:alpha-glucosidase/alpha-galactosidase [Paenibacillus sp. GP183]SEB55768.1 alpha-galactosidase [Paenibacillus sp. GP183]